MSFPDLESAHRKCTNHRSDILRSDSCGCFHSCATFPPEEIREWLDEVNGVGTTALCPKCGIDSVIGSASGIRLHIDFLTRMRTHWF